MRNEPNPADEDLVILDGYRELFVEITRSVVDTLESLTTYKVVSRPKSVPSIVAKLRRRQPARLSAIQDMAGARIIVADRKQQDELVARIASRYPDATVEDKRARPAFGYRAVHVITFCPLPFEIQRRTELQHAWAQLSERLADRYGFELKYGGGPEVVRSALLEYAEFGAAAEEILTGAQTGKPIQEALLRMQYYMARMPEILEAVRIE